MNEIDPHDLIAMTDIGELFGVNQSAVSNWRVRYEDFPQPITVVANGKTPVFSQRAIIRWWLDRHPHLQRALRDYFHEAHAQD